MKDFFNFFYCCSLLQVCSPAYLVSGCEGVGGQSGQDLLLAAHLGKQVSWHHTVATTGDGVGLSRLRNTFTQLEVSL